MKFNGKDITELLGINRRNFIKLAVGGAVGTGLSPLPWKLTDDIAIWTQNWPWLSVPSVGRFNHVKSVCTLCRGGCGINVRKVDNRAVKIEGRTDYPVNPGGICPIGAGGLQLLYNESSRFTGPMKRIGPRGSGKFQDITWNEALNTLSGRISSLRKKGTCNALAAIDGNHYQSTMALLIEHLITSIGSPNYLRVPTSEDTSRMVDSLMQGSNLSTTYDLENSDYILSFGSGLLEGWGSPGRVLNAWGLWRSTPLKGKVKIVQIESRTSNTASKADQWVPARPGTETALALSIAHVMIKENLYDQDFVEKNTFGFTDWTSSNGMEHKGFKTIILEKYSPADMADITGIKAKTITSLAKDFARSKAPVAICGKGKGTLNGSVYEFMAIRALNALKGNINKPGGLIVREHIPLNPLPNIELDTISEKGLKNERIDLAGSEKYPFTHSLFNNFAKEILKEKESPIDTLLVFSANPAFTLPDGGAFRKALEKIPFIVSFSPYCDETAYMADLILPDHCYLEKMDDIVQPPGLHFQLYGLTKPVVDPVYNTKHTGDCIIQLARLLNGSIKDSFPWRNYEEILKIRAKGLFESKGGLTVYDSSSPFWKDILSRNEIKPDYKSFDDMWDKIKSGGLWYRPLCKVDNSGFQFNTPSGKFEFFSNRLASSIQGAEDKTCIPHFDPSSIKEKDHGFPLQMVPYELINFASGSVPSPPYTTKTLFEDQLLKNESFAEINTETADKYHLKDGDRVLIESAKGSVKVRVKISNGAMPGIVYLPLGLGHQAYDDFLKGKGVNPNEIISGCNDTISGHPVWWNTPVRLKKV